MDLLGSVGGATQTNVFVPFSNSALISYNFVNSAIHPYHSVNSAIAVYLVAAFTV